MSHAGALFSTSSQLSRGVGITCSALCLYLADKLSRTSAYLAQLPAISYRLAFVALALLCLVAMADILLLDKQAGSQITGKTDRQG